MPLDLSLTALTEWDDFLLCLNSDDLDIDRIHRAFEYAKTKHLHQKRESGDDYFTHPFWVAKVVAQLSVGDEAVMAAILHDCVEDTDTTLNDMSRLFGDEVALLVDGLTEVKKHTKDIEVHQTNIEVFRHFLFSSVNDVRVLIIRLVDKLHNGLTIHALSPDRQLKYAHRAFGIYGPVAEYVGLHYFKRLIEDIAFEILYPEEFQKLKQTFSESAAEEIEASLLIKDDLDRLFTQNHLTGYLLQSRVKSFFSTYQKIQAKGLARIKDRVGLRVITDSVTDCYLILGLLHARYHYLPEEFDDYISKPKANGYRSLQTTIVWLNGLTVEIQIRTRVMHDFNEFGPASHIAYKSSKNTISPHGYEWVRDLVKWQRGDNQINNYRLDVLSKFVYVFTPKGDTLQLPAGCTALDYAYRIHTDIGDHCAGAMINNKMAKIDTVLKTGDLVDILTNNKLNVNRNWLKIVTTKFAKEHIRKMFSQLPL